MKASSQQDGIERTILGRRSIRRYLSDPVPVDLVWKLLALAARAPSAHNRQPWRFVIVHDAKTKQTLAQAMGERLRSDRARDGDDADAIERDVERSRARITGAPTALLICLTLEEMDTYPDSRRADSEFIMAVQSTAMAVENILLGATAEGLGACWMCAPLFCPDTVRAALDIPESWHPQGLVTLGWPADNGRDRPRKPAEDVAVARP
jgi:F420 biosynthesis protein FbiB-like protein